MFKASNLTSGHKSILEGKRSHTIYLILGSNLGDRVQFLTTAREEIGKQIGTIKRASSIYVTEPWQMNGESAFLNQVLEVNSELPAVSCLDRILSIEKNMGRERSSNEGSYQSREIDIDILYFDDQVIQSEKLVVPHPRIQDRRFVLVPMSELNPRYLHPILNETQLALLEKCEDQLNIEMY